MLHSTIRTTSISYFLDLLMPELIIKNLSVARDDIAILNDITVTVQPGSVHAILGPNGSGKSTLACALMGHPQIAVTQGSILLDGNDITSLAADKRAQLGIFLSFQNPPEIPGVKVITFLSEAYRALQGTLPSAAEFRAQVCMLMDILYMDHAFLERNLNDGFSGGEKKRFEMLQVLLFQPRLIIFDEIDSGLDIDALKHVANAIAYVRARDPLVSIIIITHYQRILDYLQPDYAHIIIDGTLVHSSDYRVVATLEHHGYDFFKRQNNV